MDNLQYIIAQVPAAARMEQLAEEATELAQAALKVARIMRAENPTPVDIQEALRAVREEYTDTFVAAMAAELLADGELGRSKLERWAARVKERTGSDHAEN